MNMKPIHIIGGGLAGSEAAWQVAEAGVPVILHEMRGVRGTDAHKTDGLAELVCSNSFRSDDAESNAVGLLHAEMRLAGSLIMACGDDNQVPAGGALAVDRDGFSDAVTRGSKPSADHHRARGSRWPAADGVGSRDHRHRPADRAVARRGHRRAKPAPMRSPSSTPSRRSSISTASTWMSAGSSRATTRSDRAAPARTTSTARWTRRSTTPSSHALIDGEKTEFKEWEGTPYFDGCLPIEVMAERGPETLRHGPMKPMGLTNAHNPTVKAYAVVQLRQDNALGTLYNMVGFQTKLKYGEQARVFRMIPGLENAEFARLGGLHRNTYINSPTLLDRLAAAEVAARPALRRPDHRLRGLCRKRRIGLLAGRFAAAERSGRSLSLPPATTAFGALLNHITGGHIVSDDEPGKRSFQPMNVNFGLFPPLEPGPTQARRRQGASAARTRPSPSVMR